MRFTDWNDMTMDKLGNIKMDQSGKLMDMDSRDGRIKLHYNEDLVVLLREVSLCYARACSRHAQLLFTFNKKSCGNCLCSQQVDAASDCTVAPMSLLLCLACCSSADGDSRRSGSYSQLALQ